MGYRTESMGGSVQTGELDDGAVTTAKLATKTCSMRLSTEQFADWEGTTWARPSSDFGQDGATGQYSWASGYGGAWVDGMATRPMTGGNLLTLPSDYVAGTNLTVRYRVEVEAAMFDDNYSDPNDAASYMDCEAYKISTNGVGKTDGASDICTTSPRQWPHPFGSTVQANREFTIDGSGLSPGDMLQVIFDGRYDMLDAVETCYIRMLSISVDMSVKG